MFTAAGATANRKVDNGGAGKLENVRKITPDLLRLKQDIEIRCCYGQIPHSFLFSLDYNNCYGEELKLALVGY